MQNYYVHFDNENKYLMCHVHFSCLLFYYIFMCFAYFVNVSVVFIHCQDQFLSNNVKITQYTMRSQ